MIDCSAHALTRQRHTTSQVGLTAQARRDNVRTAFSANPALVGGRSLLIIDDVLTTGSTLAACADAALQAGALQVYGLTVTAARQ
jgi:predicted amidophosphoribosyltransferase